MRNYALDYLFGDEPVVAAIDDTPVAVGVVLQAIELVAPLAEPAPEDEDTPAPTPVPEPTELTIDGGTDDQAFPPLGVVVPDGEEASVVTGPTLDEVDAVQILRDRPDVYAAFYREFYGPNNDRHSPAWVDRVGGDTPEDYARYWYKTYGQASGYVPSASSGLAAPSEDEVFQGRTTIDGIPLSKILADRPDVFQAFFTEYCGAGNDRHSDAWMQRVGGSTVEDFTNYWYNAHGRLEGYMPSATPGQGSPQPEPDPVGASPDPEAPILSILPGQSLFDDASIYSP